MTVLTHMQADHRISVLEPVKTRTSAQPAARPARRAQTGRTGRGGQLGARERTQELAALDWQLKGACLDHDEQLFFGPAFGRERREEKLRRIRAAKEVCARCPVRDACRGYSLANREEFGVWGGLSEQERRELTGDTRVRRRG